VYLDDLAAARPLVQKVDVLGDDRVHEAAPLQLGECAVGIVRLGVRQHREAWRVEAPHLRGIGAERLERAVLQRIELRPDSGGRPEVRDTALGRNPGAGEHDARPARFDQRRQLRHRHGSRF
jgi:hypothetical protein